MLCDSDLLLALAISMTCLLFLVKGAGDGGLSLEIQGPAEAKTAVHDHGDGSCTVEYVPPEPGVYQLGIMYGAKKEHIPGKRFFFLSCGFLDLSE